MSPIEVQSLNQNEIEAEREAKPERDREKHWDDLETHYISVSIYGDARLRLVYSSHAVRRNHTSNVCFLTVSNVFMIK